MEAEAFVQGIIRKLQGVGYRKAHRVGLTVAGVDGWRVAFLLRNQTTGSDVAEMTVAEKQAAPDLRVAVVHEREDPRVSMLRDDCDSAIVEVANRTNRMTAATLRLLKNAGPGGYSETLFGGRRAEIRPRMALDDWLTVMLGWRLYVVPAKRHVPHPVLSARGQYQDYNVIRSAMVEAEIDEQLAHGGRVVMRSTLDLPAGRWDEGGRGW